MKNLRKTTVALLASAFILTSCGGTKISNDDGVAQLTAMADAWSAKYNLDDSIPEDLAKLYLTVEAEGLSDGEPAKTTGEIYFSINETDAFMFSKEKTKIGSEETVKESYVVQTGEGEYASWSVDATGSVKVENSSMASLGLVLGYAMYLAISTPNYLVEELNDGATPVSFVKYNDTDLDATIEKIDGEAEEGEPTKTVTKAYYKNLLAKKVEIEQWDKDGKRLLKETIKFDFTKDFKKPTVPTTAAK